MVHPQLALGYPPQSSPRLTVSTTRTPKSVHTTAISLNELQRFIERFDRTAFNYAYKLTRSREDAEDVCQQAKIRAFRAIGNTEIQSNPEAWFLRIVRNCIFDLLRLRRRRVYTISFDTSQDDHMVREFSDPVAREAFDQVDGQISAAVHDALLLLDEEQRTLVLAYANGDFCDCTRGYPASIKRKLRTKLSKARSSIRRTLKPYAESINIL